MLWLDYCDLLRWRLVVLLWHCCMRELVRRQRVKARGVTA